MPTNNTSENPEIVLLREQMRASGERLEDIYTKIDTAASKLQEMALQMATVFAVHDQKLVYQDQKIEALHQENLALRKQIEQFMNDISAKFAAAERWRYMVIGGSVVIGFMLSKASIWIQGIL